MWQPAHWPSRTGADSARKTTAGPPTRHDPLGPALGPTRLFLPSPILLIPTQHNCILTSCAFERGAEVHPAFHVLRPRETAQHGCRMVDVLEVLPHDFELANPWRGALTCVPRSPLIARSASSASAVMQAGPEPRRLGWRRPRTEKRCGKPLPTTKACCGSTSHAQPRSQLAGGLPLGMSD